MRDHTYGGQHTGLKAESARIREWRDCCSSSLMLGQAVAPHTP